MAQAVTWLDKRKNWLPTPEKTSPVPIDKEPDMLAFEVPNKPLFRLDEVADLFQVSRSTIYRWIDEGLLKVTIIVKSKRVTRHDLLALAQKKVS